MVEIDDLKDNKTFTDKEWLKSQYVTLERSPEDIAKECKVNTVDIFRQLRDFDLLSERKSIKELGKPPNYQNKDWLYQQYINLQRTPDDIAKECNVSVSTIFNWLRAFNINIRGSRGGLWTDKEWLEHQLFILNKGVSEIAKMCNTSKSTIWHWIGRLNIKIEKEKPKYADKKWLKNQYIDLRKSSTKIARELGVTTRTISNWLIKLKIPVRTLSESRLRGDEKYTDKKWLNEQYQDLSKPIYKIAEESNTSVATLQNWAKKFGIKREGKFRPIQEKQIYMDETWLYTQYWEHGKTIKEIAKECNVNGVTIFNWIMRKNIPTRPSSAYKHPSGLERQFIQFIEDNELPFRYVGTNYGEKLDTSNISSVPWGYILPDFKHISMKIVIEIGNKRQKTRMHKKFDSWIEYEKNIKKAYEMLGWKPIIVWDDEFENNPEKVLNDIKTVIGK